MTDKNILNNRGDGSYTHKRNKQSGSSHPKYMSARKVSNQTLKPLEEDANSLKKTRFSQPIHYMELDTI